MGIHPLGTQVSTNFQFSPSEKPSTCMCPQVTSNNASSAVTNKSKTHKAVTCCPDKITTAGMSDEQKPKCWSNEASFGQYPVLTGAWEDSTDERFEGFYDATENCPTYGHDFDCRKPYKGAGNVHTAYPCLQCCSTAFAL